MINGTGDVAFVLRLRVVLPVILVALAGCGERMKLQTAAELRGLFNKTEQDLGAIRVGNRYSATYRLTNSTGRTIVVSDIKTSCGCLAADYDSSAISPGGYRDISLSLNPDQQTVLGPMVKHAWVRFADGGRVELQLRARLEPEFEVEPRVLKFVAGKPERLALIRKQIDPASFRKLVLIAPPEFYESVEQQESATSDRREFLVTLKAMPASSSLPVIAVSDAPSGKPLPLSIVQCSRQGPTLRPSACVFVVSGDALPPPQQFEIVDPMERPIHIVSVEAAGESARRRLAIKQSADESFQVALVSLPDQPISNLEINVAYRCDDGTEDRLLLPCHIVVAPKPD